MGRFGSVGQALASLGGRPSMTAEERERLKPKPLTPREIGEHRKEMAKLYPKPKPRAKAEKGTLPPPPPKNRAERRRRAQEGGGIAP